MCSTAHAAKLCRLLVLTFALLGAVAFAATAGADQPPAIAVWQLQSDIDLDGAEPYLDDAVERFDAWQPPLVAQAQAPRTCAQLRFTDRHDISLVLTDADLIAESDGSRLCLLFDPRWDSYSVWLLNHASVEEFRHTKAQFQPVLDAAGIDLCRIGFWTTVDTALRRQIALRDRQDAGRPCEPELIAHGPKSEQRIEEVRAAIATIRAAGEQTFRWPLTWPLRVHLYDDHDSFVTGVRREGGDDEVTRQRLETVFARAGIIANGMYGFMVDTARFRRAVDVTMVVAHEYTHMAQAGVLGCTCYLPWFAIEGGAEYFASLVVGSEQRDLAGRFRDAVREDRAGRAVPLRELVRRPRDDDQRRSFAGYTRGYAAMRFLTLRWGAESFTHLHLENVEGSPNRFVEAMERLTGLSLDAFDQELSAYLRSQEGSTSATGAPANVTFVPNSLLTQLLTIRALPDGDFEQAAHFTGADAAVVILLDWGCLQRPIRGEARIIQPNGQRFVTFGRTRGPGCAAAAKVEFPLDDGPAGRTARAYPGLWHAEIYADGVLQGTVTFTVE